MNTTARIETTGMRDKIHISQDTADHLIQAGKSKWIVPREDKVIAKGKGELSTWWLNIKSSASDGSSVSERSSEDVEHSTGFIESRARPLGNHQVKSDSLTDKKRRLVIWCADILAKVLKEILVERASKPSKEIESKKEPCVQISEQPISEVKDILEMPQVNERTEQTQINPDSIAVPQEVIDQLETFVTRIAVQYNDSNGFHNVSLVGLSF